jgi:hypothetical protein
MLTSSTRSVLALVVGSFVAIACSSAPASSTSDKNALTKEQPAANDGKNAGTAPSGSAAAPSASGKTPASVPSGASCAAKANHEDCASCCDGADGANTKVADDAVQKCICDAAKSKCTAECAQAMCSQSGSSGSGDSTSSSDSASSDADPCDSCFNQIDFNSCDATAKKACDADPTCAAAQKCYDDAKCDGKPAGPNEDEASSSSSSN